MDVTFSVWLIAVAIFNRSNIYMYSCTFVTRSEPAVEQCTYRHWGRSPVMSKRVCRVMVMAVPVMTTGLWYITIFWKPHGVKVVLF